MNRNRIVFLCFSALIHGLLLCLFGFLWPAITAVDIQRPQEPMVVQIERPDNLEQPEKENDGQIVDLPDPVVEEKPDEAEYLAEKERAVEKETKTDRYRINPEVLSEEFSTDDQLQFEDVLDLNVHKPSTGATPGNDQFRPEDDGPLASIPSPYLLTNKRGLQSPTVASSTNSNRAGAPNNDRILEETGDMLRLNTNAYRYASYMNQIRRIVNFYWSQNLQNLDAVLIKSKYRTVVTVVIDSKGGLTDINIEKSSGLNEVDECVISAFQMASPFPEPPAALVESDGKVYLPVFGFELDVSPGRESYDGIDPRAGVRFPGILKASR
jgi:TonB family protein